MSDHFDITNPNPCALVESLRSVGYILPTAIADIVDNSVTAKANEIYINFHWSGSDSWISILDNGFGMSEVGLIEAMRPGTKNPTEIRDQFDLGRFGLGLKTASFSQCRQVTVWSKENCGEVAGRRWDLDYVSKHNEWRLQKGFAHLRIQALKDLEVSDSGTLVLWEKLDRLVDDGTVDSEEAHQRFLTLIEDVKDYLSMIFHRLIEGNVTSRRNPLKIYVNGSTTQHALIPWNPFQISQITNSQESPVEVINYLGHQIRIKGYVLPHKDRLTEQEYIRGGGHRGWITQQGFYIYRNDRILLAGDWLKLGRGRPWPKEEQYKLARLSVDIPNALDLEWSLDVKKSTARPPPKLRGRLTGLAENIRIDAKNVFTHRGQYGPRPTNPTMVIEKPWESKERGGHIVYKINRKHPLVKSVSKKLGPLKEDMESLLRLVEETVPVQRIWLDTAESELDHAIPYEDIDENLILDDMRRTYNFLRQTIKEPSLVRAYLSATEPFNRYQNLLNRLLDEE